MIYKGREALGVFTEALHSEDDREQSKRAKAHGLSIELPDRELGPCRGLERELVENTSFSISERIVM